jgi:hypothetical protein
MRGRPAAGADGELRVLGLAVRRGGHIAGQRAGAVPTADVLERAVAGVRNGMMEIMKGTAS